MTLHKIETAEIYRRLDPTRSQGDCAARIAHFCQKWGIIELALFGSVLRDDFRPDGKDPSDIDLLYTKAPEVRYGFKVFDMQDEIQQLLSHKVDLISKRSIQNSQNPLRRQEILNSAQVIYAGGSASNSLVAFPSLYENRQGSKGYTYGFQCSIEVDFWLRAKEKAINKICLQYCLIVLGLD